MNHNYLISLVVLKPPSFRTQNYGSLCLMSHTMNLITLHVSNWWPADQMWPAMSFYVASEANFSGLYLFTKVNDGLHML